MPFNSLKYFIFLPVVYLVFYFVGERARWCVLLAASLLFYATLNVPNLLIVLFLVTITTYGFGKWLEQAESGKAKRTLLWAGVTVNVLILVVMKYLPFLSENLQALLIVLSPDTQIQPVKAFVAIGVSYYVFQAISYLFDIYLEIEKPERHFGYFALYLSFFPKLLQGPIERAGDLIPQLKTRYEFNYDNMRFGMLLFTWGLFKKVVIADRLAIYVNYVYNDVHAFSGLTLLLATYAYAIQIYMDFSGYTDMALGSARLFNIQLTQNFNSPYFATSIADFWRRWHITFSRWILDYIFKPLQMRWRDWNNLGTATALIATFLISGIWHGASWGFVIWGGLHGFYMACSVFSRKFRKKLHTTLGIGKSNFLKVWQIVITFNLVCFAWIFFRANNLKDANYIVSHLFDGMQGYKQFLFWQGKTELLILAILLALVAIISYIKHCSNKLHVLALPLALRWPAYILLIICIILFNVDAQKSFIYFQF